MGGVVVADACQLHRYITYILAQVKVDVVQGCHRVGEVALEIGALSVQNVRKRTVGGFLCICAQLVDRSDKAVGG